jgi:hypothetical protein
MHKVNDFSRQTECLCWYERVHRSAVRVAIEQFGAVACVGVYCRQETEQFGQLI